jgi:hypothetical protein
VHLRCGGVRHRAGGPSTSVARAPCAQWTTYRLNVTPEEVGVFVESLPQVKRKGSAEHPAWYVHDRLVAPLLNPATLVEAEFIALDVLHHQARLIVLIGTKQTQAPSAERFQSIRFSLERRDSLIASQPNPDPHVQV